MLNIFNKNENTTESPLWKWAYIGLVILISVAYFIFSYHYVQESRYLSLGEFVGKFEVSKSYLNKTLIQFAVFYIFILIPIIRQLILGINQQKVYFLLLWFFLIQVLPLLIFLIF